VPLPTDTFEFFVKEFYLPLVKVKKSPTTVHSDNWRCEQLIEYFGKYKLCEISHVICVVFQEERKNRINQFDRQESNASVNRIIEVLQRIFSVAVDFEVLGKNPAAKVSMLKETPRDRIMTYEEEARIAPQLNLPTRRMLRLAVVIALNAGLRKSEILKLRKADLDFERELIIIRKAKTGNRYALMNSLVRQAIFWTVNLGALGPDDMVFGGVDWIKDTWPQVCQEAKVSNLHFHDLRATYTTRMLENGYDAFTACDATGHKDIKTTAIYAQTTSKRMREAVNSLADENLSQICLTIKNGCSDANRATA
jgi:integrase